MNPLIAPSDLPYHLPPFADIAVEHYLPAFDVALDDAAAEINAIVTNPNPPTWENTVEALEKAGQALARVEGVFFNLYLTDGGEDYEAIAKEIIPRISAHSDSVYHNATLYQRLVAATTPADDPEAARLKDTLIRRFIRHGAELDEDGKKRLASINARLATLADSFGAHLRESTTELAPTFTREELSGLDEARINSAKKDAEDLGRSGYVLPLKLPSVQPDQAHLTNADTRRTLYAASLARGAANTDIVIEMAQLRAKRAQLLGYPTHAHYVIAEETAHTPQAVHDMLHGLAPAAATNAAGEYKLLVEAAAETGDTVEAADWAFWANTVKTRDFDLNDDELRQYFPLDRVIHDGIFYTAHRLYGLSFTPRTDLIAYHPDVDIYEVHDHDGTGIGLLLLDYFARPSKRGGAWMSSFVDQAHLTGHKPVIVNVCNITKPADGSTPKLSLNEVTTVFHEFGHGLHGLLSNVRYPTFAGTNVPRDYVEFPSQINENWALDPSILANYARHTTTGQPLPDSTREAITAAAQFGQGFATTEYLAAALIDLAWHSLTPEQAAALGPDDIDSFERKVLNDAGLDKLPVSPRFRSRYFNHIFAGGYSAGYYSYLWAEALDADGFDWFTDSHAAGEDATAEDARRAGDTFRRLVLSAGGSRDYEEAFRQLRGRDKDLGPLLARRGLGGAMPGTSDTGSGSSNAGSSNGEGEG